MASTVTASSARRSGDAGREESSRSRRACADSGRLGVCVAVLGRASGGSGLLGGGQEHLHVGVRCHGRPDVAALDHDPARADRRALHLHQSCTHLGDGGDGRHRGGHPVGADGAYDVDAVDRDRGRARGRFPPPARACTRVPATAPASCTSTPCSSIHQVTARYIEPGVQVAQPESPGDSARDGGLPRTGRAVDGDDDRAQVGRPRGAARGVGAVHRDPPVCRQAPGAGRTSPWCLRVLAPRRPLRRERTSPLSATTRASGATASGRTDSSTSPTG